MKHLILLTGHSRGLGRGMAQEALARGFDVRGISRKKTEHAHPRLAEKNLDLSEANAWEAAADFFTQNTHAYDRLTLIHNAGVLTPVGLVGAGISPAQMAKALQLNVVAVMALTELWVAAVQDHPGDKRIIGISSGAGRSPKKAWSTYCATKAAMDMYFQTFRAEQQSQSQPVQAVALAPGVIDTDMQGLIRSHTEAEMPGVDRFRALKTEGYLWSPKEAARRVWDWQAKPDRDKDVLADLRNA